MPIVVLVGLFVSLGVFQSVILDEVNSKCKQVGPYCVI